RRSASKPSGSERMRTRWPPRKAPRFATHQSRRSFALDLVSGNQLVWVLADSDKWGRVAVLGHVLEPAAIERSLNAFLIAWGDCDSGPGKVCGRPGVAETGQPHLVVQLHLGLASKHRSARPRDALPRIRIVLLEDARGTECAHRRSVGLLAHLG